MPATVTSLLLVVEGVAVLAAGGVVEHQRHPPQDAPCQRGVLDAMAGCQIAGASFRLLFGASATRRGGTGCTRSPRAPDLPQAITALALFALFALLIDRRSLLLSSLTYLAAALTRVAGIEGPAALLAGATAIGVILLALSGLWRPLRARLLASLPVTIRAQLPRAEIVSSGARPVA